MALPAKFVETARQRFADKALDNQRAEQRDDFAFVAGVQWTAIDKAELDADERPALTFNYSEKMVDAVVGAELNNRQEVSYRPRGMEDAALGEVYTEGARWARDQSGAEFEESDAFRDMLICGLGWVKTSMDYTTDPDGTCVIERKDPLMMEYDPAAYRPGLRDRRWNSELEWVNEQDAKKRWPNAVFPDYDDKENTSVGVRRIGRQYEDRDADLDHADDIRKEQVLIRYYETWVLEDYWRVARGEQMVELTTSEYNAVKDDLGQVDGVKSVKQKKRVYYYGYFAGDTLLESGLSPCQKGFCYTPITGKRDRNRNTWYGLTRQMKDPQRWGNKWLSQILYIINANAKGGLLAEEGAFVDARRAEDEWASPDSITMLNEGGIDKIKEKGQAQYPAGLDKLMQFALGSLPMVTGINLEALGLANREQAGVLESQRKQAAYGILSPYFDAMRLYRRSQGIVLLDYLRNYLSDGRWLRVLGNDLAPAFQLTKVPDNVTFDIIVDQAPTAPDVKQRTWEGIVEILPGMLKAGVPIPPDILDYTPLPAALSAKWKKFIEENAGRPSPEQMQQMQAEHEQAMQENQQMKLQLKDKRDELELKRQQAEAELKLKIYELEAELAIAKAKATADIEMDQMKLQADSDRENMKAKADANNQRIKVQSDMKLKAIEKGLSNPDTPIDFKVDMEDLDGALKEVAQTNQQLAQTIAQTNAQIAQALGMLAQVLAAPKVATMPDGRRITVNPATSTLQ